MMDASAFTLNFPLFIEERHLIADLPGGRALIDTGSPMTLARSDATVLPRAMTGLAATEILDAVQRHTGLDVAYLIGCDLLGDTPVKIDCVQGMLATYAEPVAQNRLPMRSVLGLPAIEVHFDGTAHLAILDSGAQYSYVPATAVTGRDAAETVKDFHPLVGSFVTPLYEIVIATPIGSIPLRCGVLPDTLAALARPSGGWIVGIDYFAGRSLVLDLRNQWHAELPNARRHQ